MKRIGFILKVKPEHIVAYKKDHERVWQDMLDALRETGWGNYSLFMRDDGMLFGYFETPTSLQQAQAEMANKEVNARWQAAMSHYFELPPGARPDQMMMELEEVFHTD
ncbi:MAG: L-rhamnose mutarotase [Chloroflexota bacterium]|nr:L-rhamnose mutarotase [Chloroflexota bacterium]